MGKLCCNMCIRQGQIHQCTLIDGMRLLDHVISRDHFKDTSLIMYIPLACLP